SKTKIVRALTVITGFTPTYQNGIRPWLGHKNFAALMRRLAQIYPEIEVRSLGKGKVEVIWRDGGGAPRPAAPEAEEAPRETARSQGSEDYEPAQRPLTSPA
ncbi:MAG TPA: hypothetical protein DCY26_13995, partial [Hyphomonas sp.]|nr:hypothetical protein [Hyphomonas sp.]